LKPEVGDLVTAYLDDKIFTGEVSVIPANGKLKATVTDGTNYLNFNYIEPGISATMMNPSSLTGHLKVMVRTKKYNKLDHRYLPICSVEGEAYNSINLNNTSDAKATAPISTAANYGKAIETGAFAVNNSTASGGWSFANGSSSEAKGLYSHAEGQSTIASGTAQHVEGKYNIEDIENKYAHIVGNGGNLDSNNVRVRSNAYTLDWQGNGTFAGTVKSTGVILSSPNGTDFLLTVNDSGELNATALSV
jgi:hypothetical protein